MPEEIRTMVITNAHVMARVRLVGKGIIVPEPSGSWNVFVESGDSIRKELSDMSLPDARRARRKFRKLRKASRQMRAPRRSRWALAEMLHVAFLEELEEAIRLIREQMGPGVSWFRPRKPQFTYKKR